MRTLLIKNRFGRVVEVEEKHGRFLIEKDGASIVLPSEKPTEKPTEKPETKPEEKAKK